MKALVALLFFVFALVHGFPGKWPGSREYGKPGERRVKNWRFQDLKVALPWEKKPWNGKEIMDMGEKSQDTKIPRVRWCVTNPCEMKKCKRMVTEFNYMVSPRLAWSCVMKDCKESCMEAIRRGEADIMMAEGEEIYKGGKMYDLIPIMAEKDQSGRSKHYSIVLAKKTNTDVNSYQDMSQKKSCHSGVDIKATFKSPMCSLIKKGVVPKVGNVYECAGEFFKESCVPGVQHEMYNPNMTNPESLCKLCKGSDDDDDFCETLSDKEPYYGFKGTLKCLREGQGDVGFFHTYDIIKNYQTLRGEFDIVCKNKRHELNWENIDKTDCHLTEEHPQVAMVSADKPKDWIRLCINASTDASMKFSSSGLEKNTFQLFDSSPYCAKGDDKGSSDDKLVDKDETKWDMSWKKNKDLIFKDHCSSLEPIKEDQRTYIKFLGIETVNTWKTCEQLEPKPRAFICVVGDEEMKKCTDMIGTFETITDLKKISWGCVNASCKKECVEMVAKNLADVVDLNATEMFTAGIDYNLAPFIGENYKGKDPWTESITIGVMRKDSTDLPEDMRGWKMCNAGVHKISGFLHPMGWLLANGTIERSISPLKSIGLHFGESCVPGMNTLDLIKHPLFSRTLDWKLLLRDKDVKWVDWYKTPLWRKWQDKQSGVDVVYQPMYEMQDFESPEFQKMLKMMMSDDPLVHAYHTPEIHEMMEKVKKDFSWNNYNGLEDFYGLPFPKWKLISWIWQKPENWTEVEWDWFMMWAEKQWDQTEDWAYYVSKWTDADWVTFKKWMDAEYKDYKVDHMHQDTFIRLSLLCCRHHWLMNQWKNLQWDNIDIKHCREKMCSACAGEGDKKCAMDAVTEDYYGYTGSLKCLKEKDGDVAFMDSYAFDDAITKNGYNRDDFVLLCPDGKTVDVIGRESVEECNFGRVPSHVLATCNMHDGVWRWKVTKALLEAQKVLTPEKIFKDGIFGEKTESLTPIPFVNQTYQVWLGPMFLRAMEGFMQPPVKANDWQEEMEPIMDACEGEDCDEDVQDRFACDECEEGDAMCMENCWKMESVDEGKMGANEMMEMGGIKRMPGMKRLKKPKRGMWKRKMLWKPKGKKMHPMWWKKPDMMKKMKMKKMMMTVTNMGPMDRKGPMMHGMKPKMPGMMPMKPMRYDMEKMKYMDYKKKMWRPYPMSGKMMHHYMETGPMMHSWKSLRGEFYTNVIFTRKGTCNAIVHDLSCFGETKNIRMWAGRVGKTPISVPMCPRPTIMKKTTAQFTCNTGASFLKPVTMPVRCSYVPCNPGFWLPDWTYDKYWDGDNSYPEEYWGNKDWWSFDKRGENDNWFLAKRNENRVDKKPWNEDGLKWRGQAWRTM